MYSDGLLGNKGIYDAITPLTVAIFNYIRDPAKSSSYKADQIFPWIVEYQKDPNQKEENSVNHALLTFMSQAQGFSMERFTK
jgi:hypothetical protein